MSVTTDEIITKVRNLLGDILKTETDIFTYGSSDIFTLTEDNIDSVSAVYVNSVELESGDYSYSPTTNKLEILATGLTSGDTIEVQVSCYRNYSDTEILGAINAALSHISVGNYEDFTIEEESGGVYGIYPDPDERDSNLIAIVASLILEPGNISYKLPDISISVPNDSSMSLENKIKRVIASAKRIAPGDFEVL